ncbi:ABC transporter permease [Clostridium sp. D53t1_180928_C8]|uniref:ABC transporter permease n=1 Tax=Clostridium sp. D53t1_180928_C8 TaxID=2787101 RepID=UPI0018ABF4A6|nr:ABC transporter permease [Clostridium sp. D53t1_180928_C8]
MLGKLMKYEFKATARILIPLYGALIIFALINKIFMGDFFNNNDTILGNLPRVIGMIVYISTMVAIFVVTLFIIIQRYRTNLLCDEGYLMNTIPVKPWKNILSKLIVALVWTIASGIVSIISVIILAYQKGIISEIISVIPEVFTSINTSIGANGILYCIELILMMLIGGLSSILMIYASLSIGSLFQKGKILASFGAFIVLNIATNIISTIIQVPTMLSFGYSGTNLEGFPFEQLHMILIGSTIIVAAFAIIYFVISNYILSKKLNLE